VAIEQDSYLWPPADLDPSAPDFQARLTQTVDYIFSELRRLQTAAATPAAAAGAHDILSATHTDSTAASVVNGDLIVGQGGSWRRKAKGVDAQHLVMTSGAPEWSNDGSGLQNLDATQLVGVVPTPSVLHDLLSAHHPDTVPDSPVLGDIVVAVAADPLDVLLYWLDGLPFETLSTDLDVGGMEYWVDGLPMGDLADAQVAKWQRLPKGAIGSPLVSTATGVEWASTIGLSASNVHAYQGGDVAYVSTPIPTLLAQRIEFTAVARDTDVFWDAGTPGRLTVPTGGAGLYTIVGAALLPQTLGTGIGQLSIRVNGVETMRGQIFGANAVVLTNCGSVTLQQLLAAGDYVELYFEFEHSVPDATTIRGGVNNTFLQMGKL
jgi:hypothetical protein